MPKKSIDILSEDRDPFPQQNLEISLNIHLTFLIKKKTQVFDIFNTYKKYFIKLNVESSPFLEKKQIPITGTK